MSGYVNKTAKSNEGNVGTRLVTTGSDGNGEGARLVAEFGMKNEDESWLIRDFEDKCRINKEIGHDDDNNDETITDMMEELSSDAENERPANHENERVIFHWNDTLRKYVEGFRPGHKMVWWDAEKSAYVFYYYREPPAKLDWPPVFHYDKNLRACVEGIDVMETMCWWDADLGEFSRRLTQKMIDDFNRDQTLNRNN